MYTTINNHARLFFDRRKKTTFAVTPEQYRKAKERFERERDLIKESDRVMNPIFAIETDSGVYFDWIYKDDEDYTEFL